MIIKFEGLLNEELPSVEPIPDKEMERLADQRKEQNQGEFTKASEWMDDDDLWPTTPEKMKRTKN